MLGPAWRSAAAGGPATVNAAVALAASSTLTTTGTPERSAAVALTATSTLTAKVPTILFSEDFEGIADETPLTSTNTAFSSDTGVGVRVADTAFSVSGSASARISTTTAGDLSYLVASFTSSDPVFVRFYFRPDFYMVPNPETETNIAELRTASNVIRAMMEFTQNGNIGIKNNNTLVATTTTALPLDQFTRIEWSIDAVTDVQKCRLFLGSNLHGTVPDEEISGAYTQVAGAAVLWVGQVRKTYPLTAWWDEVAVASGDWVGPAAVAATVAAAATLTAASTLTAAGDREAVGAVALTATSTLTTAGTREAPAAVALIAVSVLTPTAERTTAGSAALTAVSTFTATGVRGREAVVALVAASTLTAAAERTAPAAAALTAASTLAAAATREPSAAVALIAASVLTTAATREASATVALTATSTLTTAGTRERPAAAALSAVSTLTAEPVREAAASVALTATSTLSVAATVQTTVHGTVAMSATSNLTTAGTREQPATVALTAVSTLTTAGTREATATVTLAAVSTLTATGTVPPRVNATVGLAAVSTLTTAATREAPTAAALTAVSTLTTTTTREQPASVALAATATLATAGTRGQPATVALAATSALTTAGTREQPASVTLAATSTLTAAGTREAPAAVALAASSTLTTAATREQPASAALVAVSTLTAVGTVPTRVDATAALVATSTLTTIATREAPAVAAFVATSTLAATAVREATAAAALTATSDLTTAGTREATAAAAFVAVSTLTTSGTREASATAALTAASTLTVSGTREALGVVPLIATSTLTTAATREVPASVALVAASTLTTGAVREAPSTVALTAVSTLTAAGDREAPADVAMTASSTLTTAGTREAPASVAMTATSDLTTTGTREVPAAVTLAATSTLSATGEIVPRVDAAVALAATSTLTAAGTRAQTTAAALVAASTLTAAATIPPRVNAAVALTAASTLTAAATIQAMVPGAVALTASSTLTSAATIQAMVPGAVALTAASTLTATGTRVRPATAALTAASTLSASAEILPRVDAAVAFSATSTLTTAATVAPPVTGAVAFSATSTLTIAATAAPPVPAAVEFTATSTLTATGTRRQTTEVAFTAVSTLSVAATIPPRVNATVALTTVATLTVGATARAPVTAAVALTATSTLSASGDVARYVVLHQSVEMRTPDSYGYINVAYTGTLAVGDRVLVMIGGGGQVIYPPYDGWVRLDKQTGQEAQGWVGTKHATYSQTNPSWYFQFDTTDRCAVALVVIRGADVAFRFDTLEREGAVGVTAPPETVPTTGSGPGDLMYYFGFTRNSYGAAPTVTNADLIGSVVSGDEGGSLYTATPATTAGAEFGLPSRTGHYLVAVSLYEKAFVEFDLADAHHLPSYAPTSEYTGSVIQATGTDWPTFLFGNELDPATSYQIQIDVVPATGDRYVYLYGAANNWDDGYEADWAYLGGIAIPSNASRVTVDFGPGMNDYDYAFLTHPWLMFYVQDTVQVSGIRAQVLSGPGAITFEYTPPPPFDPPPADGADGWTYADLSEAVFQQDSNGNPSGEYADGVIRSVTGSGYLTFYLPDLPLAQFDKFVYVEVAYKGGGYPYGTRNSQSVWTWALTGVPTSETFTDLTVPYGDYGGGQSYPDSMIVARDYGYFNNVAQGAPHIGLQTNADYDVLWVRYKVAENPAPAPLTPVVYQGGGTVTPTVGPAPSPTPTGAPLLPVDSMSTPTAGVYNPATKKYEGWFEFRTTDTAPINMSGSYSYFEAFGVEKRAAYPTLNVYSYPEGPDPGRDAYTYVTSGSSVAFNAEPNLVYKILMQVPGTALTPIFYLQVSEPGPVSPWIQRTDKTAVMYPNIDSSRWANLHHPPSSGTDLMLINGSPTGNFLLATRWVQHMELWRGFGGPQPKDIPEARACLWHWGRQGSYGGVIYWTPGNGVEYHSGPGTCPVYTHQNNLTTGGFTAWPMGFYYYSSGGLYPSSDVNSYVQTRKVSLTWTKYTLGPNGGHAPPASNIAAAQWPEGFTYGTVVYENDECEIIEVEFAADEDQTAVGPNEDGVTVEWHIQYPTSQEPNSTEKWGPSATSFRGGNGGPENFTADDSLPPYTGGLQDWKPLGAATIAQIEANEAGAGPWPNEYDRYGIVITGFDARIKSDAVPWEGSANHSSYRVQQTVSTRLTTRPARYRVVGQAVLYPPVVYVPPVDPPDEEPEEFYIGWWDGETIRLAEPLGWWDGTQTRPFDELDLDGEVVP